MKLQLEQQRADIETQLAQRKLEIDQYVADTARIKVAQDAEAAQKAQAMQSSQEKEESNETNEPEEAPDMNAQQFDYLTQAMGELSQTMAKVAELAAVAAGPRRSELELDADGMPCGSTSYPIKEKPNKLIS
jgi:sortase (surface protein transpeptidase)